MQLRVIPTRKWPHVTPAMGTKKWDGRVAFRFPTSDVNTAADSEDYCKVGWV